MSTKMEHAYAYIKTIVESDMVDRSAYMGQDNSVYLPYRKVSFFYGEYKYQSKDRGVYNFAGESTFRKAYRLLVKDKKIKDNVMVKLSSGKGSFDQCEICHNAEQLLHRKVWSDEQANVIIGYRRRHIDQQFAERLTLQQNIASTYLCDNVGQPKSCLFFSDGMTVMKGNTPKEGVRPSKGDKNHITCRIIGVEVHCGPVHGTFLYYTDN